MRKGFDVLLKESESRPRCEASDAKKEIFQAWGLKEVKVGACSEGAVSRKLFLARNSQMNRVTYHHQNLGYI